MSVSFGILIIAITLLGYVSNWINWQFLNYKIVRWLYFIGAFIHELSHAVFAVLLGAKIKEFRIFSSQPRVVHTEPKLPVLGIVLISLAPLFGGLLFFFLSNHFWLASYFVLPEVLNWQAILFIPFDLLGQINILEWQSWVMVLLFLNVGAMIGPSFKDLKNFWPVLLIFFFINYPPLLNFTYLVLSLILTNIILQFFFIVLIGLLRFIFRLKRVVIK